MLSLTPVFIGKNYLGEKVFEDSSFSRFALTSTGFVSEPNTKNLRFLRLSSTSESSIVIQSLIHLDVLKSFGSASRAINIYTSKPGVAKDYSKINHNAEIMFSKSVSEASFRCIKNSFWDDALGDWDEYCKLKGASGLSLAFESSIYKSMKSKPKNFEELLSSIKTLIRPGVNSKIIDVDGSIHMSSSPILPSTFNVNNSKIIFNKNNHESNDNYISFSCPELSSGYANKILNSAYQHCAPKDHPENISLEVSKKIGVDKDDLFKLLSPEQVDSVFLALRRLENELSFMVCDETGYGKGRILAAIAAAAINSGITVFFLTEKKMLFKDFKRDVDVLFKECPKINIISGDMSAKAAKKLVSDNVIVSKEPVVDCKWHWSTYSQFNRDNGDKFKNIINYVSSKKVWVIFDETQNASGSSKTNEFAQSILKASSGCVFASATFAKNEDQLSLFQSMFTIKQKDWPRVKSGFISDSSSLRLAMTADLAASGAFMRREHPPINPPEVIVCKDTSRSSKRFLVSNLWRVTRDALNEWNLLTYGESPKPWSKIGEPLARCLREAAIIEKIPDMVDIIKNNKSNNIKTVIVSDWTLSSHADESVENEMPVDGLWKTGWYSRILEMFDMSMLSSVSDSDKVKMLKSLDSIKEAVDKLPDWSSSPFDELINLVLSHNISIEEISGRQFTLKAFDEKIEYIAKKPIDRASIIDGFNSGSIDALLITRAANSGASMHAGASFADQRQRHMVELDVSPDPSVRVQFWGRVRRKDQVVEPIVSTLLIDTPSELRRMSKDVLKHKRLKSHSGSSNDDKSHVLWTSESHQKALSDWAEACPELARQIGFYKGSDPSKILARSCLLADNDVSNMVSFVSDASRLSSPWLIRDESIWMSPSRVVRELSWFSTGPSELKWVERVWQIKDGLSLEAAKLKIKNNIDNNNTENVDDVILKWKSHINSSANVCRLDSNILFSLEKNKNSWSLGSPITVLDPDTKQRRVALISAWRFPSSPNSFLLSKVIEVELVISGRTDVLSTSLSSLLEYGLPKQMKRSPQDYDFSGINSLNALLLEGPSWSVAAWGSRVPVQGSLTTLPSPGKFTSWGWVMPSSWTWDDMLAFPREIPDIKKAIEISTKNNGYKIIIMSKNGLDATASANHNGFEFRSKNKQFFRPMELSSKGNLRCSFDSSKNEFVLTVPWKSAYHASHSLISAGYMMCADKSVM